MEKPQFKVSNKFSVGDKVICQEHSKFVGRRATITEVLYTSDEYMVYVNWDSYIDEREMEDKYFAWRFRYLTPLDKLL